MGETHQGRMLERRHDIILRPNSDSWSRRGPWQRGVRESKRSFDPSALRLRGRSRSNVCDSSRSERGNSLPLSEKARIEVNLPDLPRAVYQEVLDSLGREF